ncbi:ComEC/Rec2 family competence protein [Georgenia faecalis]|uniref:ComEC/Rec2 family competence protein n=1 Tax=Georgenia faecalis TaxID=2483799 RepID=UPI000FD96C9F|nr:ComEC/Rec2 family competence protein [Georgenia faecalis]
MKPAPPVDARLVPAALAAWAAAFAVVVLPVPLALGLGAAVLLGCAWPARWVVAELRSARTSEPRAERRSAARRATGTASRPATDPADHPATSAEPRRARHRSAARAPVAAGVLVTGIVVAGTLAVGAGHVHVRETGALAALADRGARVTVTARVADDPAPLGPGPAWETGPRSRVRLDVEAVTARGHRDAARAPVLAIGGGAWGGAAVGERVVASGRLVRTDRGDDVVALLIADDPDVVAAAPAYHRVAAAMRAGLVAAVADASPQARGLVPGIAVGDDRALPPDLDAAMTAVGLTHVTAVSGAHVAIILGVVLSLLGWAPRPARVAVGVVVLVGFVVLVRPEPSVVRATTMGAVALTALLLGRPARALPGLCTAVVVLLLLDPWMARSYGFVLSVLATAGLVLLARPWAQALATRMPAWLAHAVAIPAAAQVCCAPVVVLLAPTIATYAVPANALAALAVPPATVLGVLAALCAPWWPGVAGALATGAGWCTAWIAAVARFWAGLPGAELPWFGGAVGALGLALVTVLAVVAARRVSWRPRTVVALAVVGALLVLPAPRRFLTGAGAPEDWLAVQCDVGQGSALVVRSGPSAAVMVDVGPEGGAADDCLAELGVDRLDLLVLTHLHADHVGGLADVLDGRTVDRALVGPYAEPAGAARDVLGRLADAGADVHRPTADDVSARWGTTTGAAADDAANGTTTGSPAVSWQVLWPTRAALERAPPGDEDAVNDLSLVVRLDVEDLSVMALGDTEPDGQRGLLRGLREGAGGGPVDVVVVAHHGSPHQEPALAAQLAPRLALVSVGADNDYGHPAAGTLELYGGGGALVLRTDECGTITVVRAAGDLAVVSGCG